MANITWKLPDGSAVSAEVENGDNLMDAAVVNGIPNIPGECGGCLSCATCHVYVDPDWVAVTGDADVIEESMLEAAEAERNERSRLSCQLIACDEFDGLILHVPEV